MAKSIDIATQAKDGQAILDTYRQADSRITGLVADKAALLAIRAKIQASLDAAEGVYDVADIADINAKLSTLAARIQSDLLG